VSGWGTAGWILAGVNVAVAVVSSAVVYCENRESRAWFATVYRQISKHAEEVERTGEWVAWPVTPPPPDTARGTAWRKHTLRFQVLVAAACAVCVVMSFA
jgi:hypothetical protein